MAKLPTDIDWKDHYDTALEAWNEEIDMRIARDKEIERLRGLLAKHGGHTAECASHNPYVEGWKPPKCDCGWQATAESLKL